MIGILGCLLGFVLITVLSYKNISIFISTIAAVFLVIWLNQLPVLDTLTNVYFANMGSYFATYFGMFLFGGILGQLYSISGAAITISERVMNALVKENDSENKRQILSILAVILAGGILCYGGLFPIVAIFTIYPLALNIFQKANIPKRFIIGTVLGGTVTFAMTGAGSPQAANVVAMTLLETPSSTGLIPSLIATIAEILIMVFIINRLVTKAKGNGEAFAFGEMDIIVEDTSAKPGLILSLIPLIFLLILFNFFSLNIIFSLLLGSLLAFALFFRYIMGSELIEKINDGALSAASSMATLCPVVGFGMVVRVTPGFQNIVDSLLGMDIHPLLLVVICVGILAALTGGAATGQQIVLPIITPVIVEQMGIPAKLIHRISSFAGSTLDTTPYCGTIIMATHYMGLTIKESYFPAFITTVFATSCGTAIVTVLLMIFPGLA